MNRTKEIGVERNESKSIDHSEGVMSEDIKPLDGEWALILGASSGFGESVALELASLGLNIFGVHLDRKSTMPNADRIVKEIHDLLVHVSAPLGFCPLDRLAFRRVLQMSIRSTSKHMMNSKCGYATKGGKRSGPLPK